MNLLFFTRELKQMPNPPLIYVFTKDAQLGRPFQYEEHGFNGMIPWPFKEETLKDLLTASGIIEEH